MYCYKFILDTLYFDLFRIVLGDTNQGLKWLPYVMHQLGVEVLVFRCYVIIYVIVVCYISGLGQLSEAPSWRHSIRGGPGDGGGENNSSNVSGD